MVKSTSNNIGWISQTTKPQHSNPESSTRMKPIKHLPKINSKTTKELKETTNNQSRIRTDNEYQNMLREVLNEVFPDY